MKKHATSSLGKELKQAGAADSEIATLAAIANNLERLKNSDSAVLHHTPASKWSRSLLIGVPTITGLALGMAVVMLSQTVLPGSMLYPVQKLSNNVAVSINPDYRGVIMMQQAQAVKQLIAKHANSNIVLATLMDYQKEAALYQSISTNYAAFEYCKTNLQQAAGMAPPAERKAINTTLSSLDDV